MLYLEKGYNICLGNIYFCLWISKGKGDEEEERRDSSCKGDFSRFFSYIF